MFFVSLCCSFLKLILSTNDSVLSKFTDDDDIIAQANNTMYGLAAAVFSRDVSRAINTANKLKAGTVSYL
jgi:acyl-CoA reductase-like NAD-dependent aldehyde dehydrogenase